MKIKPASKAALKRSALRKSNVHYWLVPAAPKKVGRLSQLNKHNIRKPSEFIVMAERIENERR
jgi:hypothetical protein